MSEIVLVTGGARSGKSRFAEQLLQGENGPGSVLYLATAQAFDAEMKQRIARHRQQRPASWRTVEATERLLEPCREFWREADALLLDCLTLFLTNLLLPVPETEIAACGAAIEATAMQEIAALIGACRKDGKKLVMVTNEVGSGLVPEYPLGRVFRDLAGRVNQQTAAWADSVYVLISGLPLQLKG